ncbi:hypothetical protein E2C01_052222 [Portunus trituberculatus]|uniref:Uncharacterized protein n=1 Tax=Portunus trituberculatus TaxID=210409 RepID=A0A5B7GKZ0_PORTR|nr:hypothetical protein [Portunus trituberculatus]
MTGRGSVRASGTSGVKGELVLKGSCREFSAVQSLGQERSALVVFMATEVVVVLMVVTATGAGSDGGQHMSFRAEPRQERRIGRREGTRETRGKEGDRQGTTGARGGAITLTEALQPLPDATHLHCFVVPLRDNTRAFLGSSVRLQLH